MMLRQIFPAHAAAERPLAGSYLALDLHRRAAAGDILIYANFIASLDGRIAVRGADGGYHVPDDLANARDWRLYQELAAQSDVLITSGRYFRQLAENKAQDALPIGDEEAYADVRAWRLAQGMPAQPAVAIVSASLDIPELALKQLAGRRIVVLTAKDAAARRVRLLEGLGAEVVVAGAQGQVRGRAVKAALIARGFSSAYMIAGPAVHRTLIDDDVLDLLFLTQRHVLLGGADFHTLLGGNLAHACRLEPLSLHLDAEGRQTFAMFAYKT